MIGFYWVDGPYRFRISVVNWTWMSFKPFVFRIRAIYKILLRESQLMHFYSAKENDTATVLQMFLLIRVSSWWSTTQASTLSSARTASWCRRVWRRTYPSWPPAWRQTTTSETSTPTIGTATSATSTSWSSTSTTPGSMLNWRLWTIMKGLF